jgi:hypothetical protein
MPAAKIAPARIVVSAKNLHSVFISESPYALGVMLDGPGPLLRDVGEHEESAIAIEV